MRTYRVTEKGAELGAASGLDDLVEELQLEGKGDLEVFDARMQLGHASSRELSMRDLGIVAIRENGWDYFADTYQHEFVRGFEAPERSAGWRDMSKEPGNTLFPIGTVFEPVDMQADPFVLSGAVGAALMDYEEKYPLLMPDRAEEFGFSSHHEACVFVGGYVLARLAEQELGSARDNPPEHVQEDGTTATLLRVYGDLHGDFRMRQFSYRTDQIVSPLGSEAYFGPQTNDVVVRGYHSIEPLVAGRILESEYAEGGEAAVVNMIRAALGSTSQIREDTPFAIPFGDYGHADRLDISLAGLFLLAKEGRGLQNAAITGELGEHSNIPGTDLRVDHVPEGLQIWNEGTNTSAEGHGITIERDRYKELYALLLKQAAMTLGRTSVGNHIQLMREARELVAGPHFQL